MTLRRGAADVSQRHSNAPFVRGAEWGWPVYVQIGPRNQSLLPADRWEEADRARRFIATVQASTSTDMASHDGLSHEEYPLEAGIESVWDNLAGVTSWEYRD